jgi:hypothetical protein
MLENAMPPNTSSRLVDCLRLARLALWLVTHLFEAVRALPKEQVRRNGRAEHGDQECQMSLVEFDMGYEGMAEDAAPVMGCLFFPNLMLVITDDYFATYDAQPIDADRTRLTLRVRAEDPAKAGALVESIRSFMSEDVKACVERRLATHPLEPLPPNVATAAGRHTMTIG